MKRIPKKAGLAIVLGALMLACVEDELPPLDEEYLAALDEWKQSREERLRAPEGWLSLVGLSWLEEGENTLGSDPTSDVVFPPGTGLRLGVIAVSEEGLEIRAAADSGIEQDGVPVTSMQLASDARGEPTVLELGSLSFFVIDRAGRLGVRIRDSKAPALAAFSGMDYFPVESRWVVEGAFRGFDQPRTMKIPNVMGTAFEEIVSGVVQFQLDGRQYELTPVGEQEGELFIVFGDTTNGSETYGGGRFLYAGPPAPDGSLVLDFNRAYNPPCVFTPYATCPLPPPVNNLAVAIRAGEKNWGSKH